MSLVSLRIENVRCLTEVSIEPIPTFNLFVGKNGCGKTSILEAIHFFGLGKSFRQHEISSIIQNEKSYLSVSGTFKDSEKSETEYRMGIQKSIDNKTTIKVNQQTAKNISVLAEIIPLQIIHPRSDELVVGSSKNRRQFCDWGVFHLDSTFYEEWKQCAGLLKQRNVLLKKRTPYAYLADWDEAYAKSCEKVSKKRQTYIEAFKPFLTDMLKIFPRLPDIRLEFQCGWEDNSSLLMLLKKNYLRDTQLGYTTLGSHRDDLLILANDYPVSNILSRGEQKLVVNLLKLAQGKLLKLQNHKSCLFLLDDFSSELDAENRFLVVKNLAEINSQVFINSIESAEVKPAFSEVDMQMFHVEQFQIKRV